MQICQTFRTMDGERMEETTEKMTQKILVTRSSMPELDEYVDEIRDIWESHWLTNMGEKHKRLQSGLAEYLRVENVELLTNGHMALEMAMQAMNLKGEVITTPFTFVSTTHAIVRNGLTPVFCDINPDDFTLDVSRIEGLITDQTCAIVPVHVYGNMCDVEAIEEIACRHGLKVIYDAAHAFGVTYKGKGAGSFGDASCFSFHATKVFNTIEGGAVCYRDSELGTRLYNLKNFGIRDEETVESVGANAKMNEFQAAMGLCNLRHIDEEISKRRKVVEHYRERLNGVEGIRLNAVQKDVGSNYAYFPIIVDGKVYGTDRNGLFALLKENNIIARKYFYPLITDFDCYRDCFPASDIPIAQNIAERVMTLPLYADLPMEIVDYICDIVVKGA